MKLGNTPDHSDVVSMSSGNTLALAMRASKCCSPQRGPDAVAVQDRALRGDPTRYARWDVDPRRDALALCVLPHRDQGFRVGLARTA